MTKNFIETLRNFILALIITVGLVAIIGTGGGGGGDTPPVENSDGNTPPTETIDLTVDRITTDSSVDTILSANPDSPIAGVLIKINQGTFDNPTVVEIKGRDEDILSPTDGESSGKVIDLHVKDSVTGEEITSFRNALEITFPFSKHDTHIPVVYYVDDAGNPHFISLSNIDPDAGTASFQTFHASLYTWVNNILDATVISETNIDTGFRPIKDGFNVVNLGGYEVNNKTGECWGMIAFAKWYYEKHSNLHSTYNEQVDQNATIQDVIASRAQNSVINGYNTNTSDAEWLEYSDFKKYRSLKSVMTETNQPVILTLTRSLPDNTSSHSVLAYKIESEIIWIYDPNFPGDDSLYLSIGTDSLLFKPYYGHDFSSLYYEVNLIGLGGINLLESFDHILKDADIQFTNNTRSFIRVFNYSDGDIIYYDDSNSNSEIILEGNVSSGEVLVEEIELKIDEDRYTADLDVDTGNFTVKTILKDGDNHILFYLWGHEGSKNKDGSKKLYLINTAFQNNGEDHFLSGDGDSIDIELKKLEFILTQDSETAPSTVTLDASGLEDENINSYNWTASDGQSASGETASMIFEEPGDYEITLAIKVSDDKTYTTKKPLHVEGCECDSSDLSQCTKEKCCTDAGGSWSDGACQDSGNLYMIRLKNYNYYYQNDEGVTETNKTEYRYHAFFATSESEWINAWNKIILQYFRLYYCIEATENCTPFCVNEFVETGKFFYHKDSTNCSMGTTITRTTNEWESETYNCTSMQDLRSCIGPNSSWEENPNFPVLDTTVKSYRSSDFGSYVEHSEEVDYCFKEHCDLY